MSLGDFLWPRLEAPSDVEAAQAAAACRQEVADLRAARWSTDTDAVLEEARRLADAEHERRKSADAKATTYLAIVGVMVPVLTSFIPTLWTSQSSPWLRAATALFLAVTIAYLLATGRWAFKAMAVSVSVRVDPDDLLRIWRHRKPKPRLAAELLVGVRASRDPVNAKISAVLMTQHFMLRAFVTFTLLLLLQVAWTPGVTVWEWIVGADRAAGAPPASDGP